MLDLSSLTKVDISLSILAISSLFLYFGRLIAEYHVEMDSKLEYYIYGLYFSFPYIIMPLLLAYFLGKYVIWPSIGNKLFVFVVSMDVLIFSPVVLQKLLSHYKARYENDNALPKWVLILGNLYSLVLFSFGILLSAIIVLLYISSVDTQTRGIGNVMIIVALSIATFISLSLIAFLYGLNASKYPVCEIYLKDGTVLTGRILKFHELYIKILEFEHKNRMIINRDIVEYIKVIGEISIHEDSAILSSKA